MKKNIQLKDLFKTFHLEKIGINAGVFTAEMTFDQDNQEAAWELYIEMLTRVVTQPLPTEFGDEKTALESVYSLFPTTRDILRRRGRSTIAFSKVAIPVLNQVVRPFTAKWHKEVLADAFRDENKRVEFRRELKNLQEDLRNYSHMLAELADVEDLTDLEQIMPN